MRAILVLSLLLPLSGCIANMAQFKGALGFVETPPILPPPLAVVLANRTEARVGEEILFSARSSVDPSGSPLFFRWDFGDGTRAEGAVVVHRFLSEGTYTVLLTVETVEGRRASGSVVVEIHPQNRPPTPGFLVVSQGTVPAGIPVRLSAEGFVDPDGDSLIFEWDFGDGSSPVSGPSPLVDHPFGRAGSYTVKVSALDLHAGRSDAEGVVNVYQRFRFEGNLTTTSPLRSHLLLLGPRVHTVGGTLTFDPLGGIRTLSVVLRDPIGNERGSWNATPPPATLGEWEFPFQLEVSDGVPEGTWILEVGLRSGGLSSYTLRVDVEG